MPHFEIFQDAYPELLLAAVRDEIGRAEREERARVDASYRRRQRWVRMRAMLRMTLRPRLRMTVRATLRARPWARTGHRDDAPHPSRSLDE